MPDELLHIAELIASHLRQEATNDERQELETWRDASSHNRAFLQDKVREDVIIEALRAGYRVNKEASWQKFEQKRDQLLLSQVRTPFIRRYRFAAAALFIGLVGIAIYLSVGPSDQQTINTAVSEPFLQTTPELPGNARLALANGSSLGLNKATKGRVAIQGATNILLEDSGRLVYSMNLLSYLGVTDVLYRTTISTPDIQYNTLQVPFGKKFDLTLPDGTGVTVNAGSQLRFPVAFTGGHREVELSGEAYFDVRPDAQHPFVVQTGQRKIEVLGTKFSVRNYSNEPVQTVILQEGLVRVHNGDRAVELKAGFEAQMSDHQGIRVVKANLANALSWKSGYFNFDGLDLRAAVCQLAQWHGMKVRIEKDVKAKSLGDGYISQDIPLAKLLDALKLDDLHFEIHDSTIIVKK